MLDHILRQVSHMAEHHRGRGGEHRFHNEAGHHAHGDDEEEERGPRGRGHRGGGPFGGHHGGPFGGHGGFFGGGPFGGGPFGGPRGRAKRGETRWILLDALRDGPKHGYEIIKSLEERSGGQYVPSPGTVYPTMQLLVDQGLVTADQESERRVYELTDAGRAELQAQSAQVDEFWARFAEDSAFGTIRHEVGFLKEEFENLARTAWGGLKDAFEQGDPERVRRVRLALERCRNEIREIITSPNDPNGKSSDTML